jgi:hypothetical protein
MFIVVATIQSKVSQLVADVLPSSVGTLQEIVIVTRFKYPLCALKTTQGKCGWKKGVRTLSGFVVLVDLAAHMCLCFPLVTLEESRVLGMNDAQKTVNLLERMEFLLDSLSAELRIARIDRGEVPAPSTERINAVREAESALTACDFKRRESIKGT